MSEAALEEFSATVDALVRAQSVPMSTIRLAGQRVEVGATDEGCTPRYTDALKHLPEDAGVPDLTITALDSRTTGVPIPVPPAVPEEALSRRDGQEDSYYGRSDSGRFQFCYSITRTTRSCRIVDYETRRGVFFTEDLSRLPVYEPAASFRLILHWWLRRRGRYLIHGAVVGEGDVGIMIGARGGSGKSTTTLAAALAGMQTVGDDYVAIAPSEDPPMAYSLYGTAKLDDNAAARFPQIRSTLVKPRAVGEEKSILYLADVPECRLPEKIPLRALVVPKIADVTECSHRKIPGMAALRAIGPSTMLQMPGTSAEEFRAVASLARSLPCFELLLPPDLDKVVAGLRALARELGAN